MYRFHRVLLPEWVFNVKNDEVLDENVMFYLQRYPDYIFVCVEGKFAICERK